MSMKYEKITEKATLIITMYQNNPQKLSTYVDNFCGLNVCNAKSKGITYNLPN